MALKTGTRLGPYEILAPLGAGGMGEVYRARDRRLDRDVAVKVLPERLAADGSALARFEREAKAVAALSHPNILAIHDVGTEGEVRYAVTELLEGTTLREILAAGALAPRNTVEYALQIAQGLSAAHEKGIVHRDLKPENVFVTGDGRVKILDFGLAKAVDAPAAADPEDARTATHATEPGTVLGTVGYMSPEQVRGLAADHRSDVFAFGAVLYEMLTGERAFRRDSPVETMSAILSEEPAEIPGDAVAGLARIARRCLEKAPGQRFQAARDIGFAIEAVSGVSARESAPPPSGEPAGRRSVAVLLFKDLARSPENAHLGLGLADATITELSSVGSLLVRPTASILKYQDQGVDPQQAGRDLGVDAVLDGSFQRAGSRLRVTVQLVRTSDGRSLWGSKIDTSLDDVFEMQDQVSRRIAEALEVELTPSEERRLARGGARPAGRAYELYLKGRTELFDETLAGTNRAIDAFEQARDADPGFALAWLGLARAYVRMEVSFDPEGDWLERAEAMCEKALAIDPNLPELRYLRGEILWSPRHEFDHAGAIRELLAALAGRPNLQEAHDRISVILAHVSMLDESIRHASQAVAIDPADAVTQTHLGIPHLHAGRYEEALSISESAARRTAGAWLYHQIGHCQLRLGRLGDAAETAEKSARQFPAEVLFHPLRAVIAAVEHNAPRARREVQLCIQNRKAFRHYHHAQYDVACVHALLGERDEALRWLSDAAHNGFPCHGFFETDPLLESIRGEPGFRALMDELQSECDGYRRAYEDALRTPTPAPRVRP